jgi:hypothetical protein
VSDPAATAPPAGATPSAAPSDWWTVELRLVTEELVDEILFMRRLTADGFPSADRRIIGRTLVTRMQDGRKIPLRWQYPPGVDTIEAAVAAFPGQAMQAAARLSGPPPPQIMVPGFKLPPGFRPGGGG